MRPLLIWTYHRVLPVEFHGAVSAGVFDGQLSFLRHAGYSFVDTKGLADWFAGRLDRNARYTMITFDDGWADNLAWASPVLKKHGAKAVLALNLSLVNPEKRNWVLEENPEKLRIVNSKEALGDAVYKRSYDSFMTWDELERLQALGIWDIQPHGVSHLGVYKDLKNIEGFFPEKKHWTMEYALGCPPFPGAPKAVFAGILSHPLTVLAPDLADALKKSSSPSEWRRLCREHASPVKGLEKDEEFIRRIRAEFTECKKTLADKLGIQSDAFFWPWGHYSDTGIKAAVQEDYKMLFTMDKNSVTSETPMTCIPRIAAPETLARFKKQEKIFSSAILKKIRKAFMRIKPS